MDLKRFVSIFSQHKVLHCSSFPFHSHFHITEFGNEFINLFRSGEAVLPTKDIEKIEWSLILIRSRID